MQILLSEAEAQEYMAGNSNDTLINLQQQIDELRKIITQQYNLGKVPTSSYTTTTATNSTMDPWPHNKAKHPNNYDEVGAQTSNEYLESQRRLHNELNVKPTTLAPNPLVEKIKQASAQTENTPVKPSTSSAPRTTFRASPTINIIGATAGARAGWCSVVNSNLPIRALEPNTRKRWEEVDRTVIGLAVNQTDPAFYSIPVIAKFLGRTEKAIMSQVGKLGYILDKGMIKTKGV